MADLAVILGATGGLGTAIVDAFAARGDRVIAVARSRSGVSQLQSRYPGVVSGDTADLTSRLAVDDLWERIDRLGVPRWVVSATGGFRVRLEPVGVGPGLQQLEEENSKLKRLVADLSLDRHILQEIVAKKL